MEQILTPVVSTSIDHQISPTLTPPHTEFPYPEKPNRRSSPERVESDSTLAGSEQDDHTTEKKISQRIVPTTEASRPSLSARKYDTEAPQPVGRRPVFAQMERRSTGARPSGTPNFHSLEHNDSSSDDSSSSSSDDEAFEGLGRQATGPSHKNLSPAELNQVKKNPNFRRGRLSLGNEHFRSRGKMAKDGRLNIRVHDTTNSGYLAKALGSTIQGHLHPHARKAQQEAEDFKIQFNKNKKTAKIPRMNIVIMVIGSRGDIQPFLKIGKILQDEYKHRVRIATHPAFKKFVEEDIGLEFFSIGGDPSELMSFMVKNPGLIPSFDTLTSGEVGRRRDQMFEMFQGFWRACINTTDEESDKANLQMLGKQHPFVADAIIANPPSFAHFHCAERLGIPLHLVFTFPYTPTQSFPHPLANIKTSNVDQNYTNYMSYPMVDLMTWQGLGDLVNRFRVKTLGLEPLSTLWAPGQLSRLRVPMTYLWSPGLVPKPEDWGPEIDIAGYVFLELASSFKPPEDLAKFLDRSEDPRPIIYIGFGSISGLDDPKAFCKLIFEAVMKADVKAIVGRGWGGMGDGMDVPDGVFMVDNVPHDWLFPKLDAVVHHGGAGTTAAGLKFGKPTMIVPFFGDQPFWAAMIGRAQAGAKEVWPLKKLTVERFAQGVLDCLTPEAQENAQAIAKSIEAEGDGAENAVDSFHRSLQLDGKHSMRCGIFEDRVAVWKVKHTSMRLSALAADLLVENKQIDWSDLVLLRHKEWTDFQGPGEPITGAGGVVVAAFQEAVHGMTQIPEMTKRDMKRVEKRKRKGRTVADAITVPGRFAQRTHRISAEQDREARQRVQATVNLTGEAEPTRAPTIPNILPVSQNDLRPQPTRGDTGATENLSTPVVVMRDVGKGVGHSFKAVLVLPNEMLNAVTLGFRNAPRLYGDRTVRPPPGAIKGFRQGLKVAGKELWFGFYDGVSGVVKIPYLDVREDGMSGLPKGLARGVGGLILKPVAGSLGVINYTSKGCYASVRKMFRDTQKTERWLRRARMAEGTRDIKVLKDEEAKRSQDDRRPARTVPHQNGELEEVRTTVLSRWTSHEQNLLEEARERERRGTIFQPLTHNNDRAKAT